jgi:hypothetical protein
VECRQRRRRWLGGVGGSRRRADGEDLRLVRGVRGGRIPNAEYLRPLSTLGVRPDRRSVATRSALSIRCASRTPLVVTSVHAFIWPFSRAARRPCSERALYAPQMPVNHIDGAKSSGFPSRLTRGRRVPSRPVDDHADEPSGHLCRDRRSVAHGSGSDVAVRVGGPTSRISDWPT